MIISNIQILRLVSNVYVQLKARQHLLVQQQLPQRLRLPLQALVPQLSVPAQTVQPCIRALLLKLRRPRLPVPALVRVQSALLRNLRHSKVVYYLS